jgi:hypothetical protein
MFAQLPAQACEVPRNQAPPRPLLLAFFAAVAAAARRALAGKGAMRPAEAAAVLAACVVWLAHACVDWDWEMPGLTGPAFVLSATLFQRGRRRRSRRRGSPASS